MSRAVDVIENTVHTDGSGLGNEISTLVSTVSLQGANGVISGTVIANGSNQPEVNGLAIGANGNNTTKGFNNFNQSFTNQAYTSALPDGDSWLYCDNTGILGITEYEPQFDGKVSIDGADNSNTSDSVPLMTNYTTPSGEVIYSLDRVNQEAYRVFDNATPNGWSPTSGTTTGYVGYSYPTAKSINKYTVQARSGGGFIAAANPRDWTFEASNTGDWSGEEVILDTVTNEIGWTNSEKRTFTFENTISYLYYRMNVSANNGDGTFLTVGELEFIETQTSAFSDYYDLSTNEWKNNSDVVYTNGRSYLAKINSADGANNTSTTDSIETHTANVGTNGTISASQSDGGEPFQAVNDNGGTNSWNSGADDVQWLQYQFNTPKAINKMILTSRVSELDRTPITWTIEASNTGAFAGEEVVLDTVTNEPVWGDNESRTYTWVNGTAYSYYRIEMTDKVDSFGKGTEYYIGEWELIETQSTIEIDQLDYTPLGITDNFKLDSNKALVTNQGSIPLNNVKAFVNFDGTTTPPTSSVAYNVSNIDRTATGRFLLDIDGLSNTNYAVIAFGGDSIFSTLIVAHGGGVKTTTQYEVVTRNASNSLINADDLNVIILGGV
jgi:hypothetical protein